MNEQNTTILSRYELGDMTVLYMKENGRVGYMAVPTARAEEAACEVKRLDPLVQLYIRGDILADGFINGFSLAQTKSPWFFSYEGQRVNRNGGVTEIVTTLVDQRGYRLRHHLTYKEGNRGFTLHTVFENHAEQPVVLDHISSFTLGTLSPFGGNQDVEDLRVHRAKSWWSAEGRLVSETVGELHMERSWSGCGTRSEKFGQTGSMPVRRHFPFLAVEDERAGVTWAMQLACPSSWQIEMRRDGSGFYVNGGLADHDFGHWSKTIAPGESFETPKALLTVGEGGVDTVCQRLLDLHTPSENLAGESLPVFFNEFCTTWGNPTEENICKIAETIKGRGVDYFVIDAGWYGDGSWSKVGDWEVNVNRLPNGLEPVMEALNRAGLKAGIWFELENCCLQSNFAAEHADWLLTRYGTPINTGNRMFLNMQKPEVKAHLEKEVIGLLKKYGFSYIKVDYNDCIGMGCDHPDGLGEGLRQNMLATQDFFRLMHKEIPGLVIETCSSGGHRLEPSMLGVSDIASFSDAHECPHIPVIAANLHRLIRPDQSQIWATLHGSDSIRRLNYSLVNTLLGVMCLSGDIYSLSAEQWDCVDRAVSFYKRYSPIIRNGTSSFFGTGTPRYLRPTGWQAVARRNPATGETLLVVHTFGGDLPETIRIPVQASSVEDVLCSEDNEIRLLGGCVEIRLKANFEAIAVALKDSAL